MGRPRRRKPLPTDERTAEITDLAEDGRGVARVEGKVTFIADALPGERVRYRLTRVSRALDEGEVVEIEHRSADRITPRCPHFGICGGCSLQHLEASAQVRLKEKQLIDALRRIGGVVPDEISDPATGPVWNYRRRARLGAKFVPKKGGIIVGFRERNAPFLTPLSSCAVLDERIGLKIQALVMLLASLSIGSQLPQIEVAAAEHVALILRVLAEPSAEDLSRLKTFAAQHEFELHLQRAGPESVLPVGEATTLWYAPEADGIGRLEFRPTDFVQVNGLLAQKMVAQAMDWLQVVPGDSVLELFAGLGNFTLPLAKRGALVTAVEGEAGLVERGRQNLRNGGYDVDYIQADLFKPDSQSSWLRRTYDLALLDPPRSGAKEILPALAATRPRRIVYVSCHPGTLARDAADLVQAHGYRLRRAGVLDMFPHTTHVESMALFEAD